MTRLLTIERQTEIRSLLARDGRVLAARLAKAFRVSEDTIRRDLREMAVAGLCQRVYGGAVPTAPSEGTLMERSGKSPGRKSALARALAATIAPGSVVFVDAGSTNLAVAEALSEDAGLTVVTNAPTIACALMERSGFEIILLGGRLDPESGACLGPKAFADALLFWPDVLVLGACGVDAVRGVTAHVFEEAELKASIASRSNTVLVAATNDKLGTAAAYGVVPATRVTGVFVEHDCDPALRFAFDAAGIPVTAAAPESLNSSLQPSRSRKKAIVSHRP